MRATQNVYLEISLAMSNFRTLTECRICGGSFSEENLVLAPTGLANELYVDQQSALSAERFPLEVVMCEECKHFQLRHIVNPKRLFSDYIYRSGTSTFFQAHFESLANRIVKMLESERPKILEVGSNDGLLLSSLKERGIEAVGIEPSKVLVEECNSQGLKVIHGFLNAEIVEKAKAQWGAFDIVVGNNVFAHIDDLYTAFLDVYNLLKNNGFFIFEVADFSQIRKKGIFDSIYHEHMSFHTLTGLEVLAKRSNFTISDFDYVDSHGGSFRFILRKGSNHKRSQNVEDRLQQELKEGLNLANTLGEIGKLIISKKQKVQNYLDSLEESENFFGYGAPAKAVTFISEMGLHNIGIKGIIDDNVWKQGKYLPVSGIQILSKDDAIEILSQSINQAATIFFVFPWNLGQDLLAKLRIWAPENSKFVCFFPDLEVIKL
jgi:2-polyprenyl-3-methyl-5-hydroxy-6-metoxy-1,4-benzoquinol methylase